MSIFRRLLLITVFMTSFINLLNTQHSLALSSIEYNQIPLIKHGFSGIFWDYLNTTSEFSDCVSSECSQSLIQLIHDINADRISGLQFISSSGRLPQRFLTNGYTDFGDYDKCLEISWSEKENKAIGQYCLTSLLPKKVDVDDKSTIKLIEPYNHFIQIDHNAIFKIGFCIPSTCSKQDLSTLLSQALEPISWKVVKIDSCETPATWNQKFLQAPSAQQRNLIILSLIASLVLICSLLQYYGLIEKILPSWFSDFTIQKSFKSLIHENQQIRCIEIDVFRAISDCNTVIIHSLVWFFILKAMHLINFTNELFSYLESFLLQPLICDWPISSLLFLGGISKSLALWRKSSPDSGLTFYLTKILRRFILIQYPLIIFIMLETITPLVVSGPLVASIGQERSQTCINRYWHNLLMIQTNSLSFDYCSMATWIIAAEFHLYIFACFLIYCYRKSEKIGLFFNLISILIGYLLIYKTFYSYKLTPLPITMPLDFNAISDFYLHYHIRSYNHLWSYSLCVLLTYLIMNKYHQLIPKAKFMKIFKVSSALGLFISFTPSIWNTFYLETAPFTNAVYSVIHRLISGTFFSLSILYYAESLYKQFSPAQVTNSASSIIRTSKISKTDTNFNNINNKVAAEEAHRTTNLKLLESSSAKFDSYLNLQNGRFATLIRKITNLAVAAHMPMLVWYIVSFKEPLSFRGWIVNSLTFTLSTFIGGFAMYFLFLGPYDNIMRRLRL